MNKNIIIGLGFLIPSVMAITPSSAQAFTLTGSVETFTGDQAKVDYWLTEVNGGVQFDFKVDTSINIGDLRGIFLNLNNADLISGITASANSNPFADINDRNFYSINTSGRNNDFFTDSSGGLIDLGGGNNLQGGGNDSPADGYHLAFNIGQQGLRGGNSDFQATSFTLNHSSQSLSLSDFAESVFGVRLMSVGDNRQGSSKLAGTTPTVDVEPEPEPEPTPFPTVVPTPLPTPAPTPESREVPEPVGILGLVGLATTLTRLRRRHHS